MTSPGILRRALGSDPELWQSAEAWMVVADLCEAEGYVELANRLRWETGGGNGAQDFHHNHRDIYFRQAWRRHIDSTSTGTGLRDTDGSTVRFWLVAGKPRGPYWDNHQSTNGERNQHA